MEIFGAWGLAGLFLAAFLASTILPLGSEPVFAALIAGGADFWACVTVATLGNTLGGMTCYGLGYAGSSERIEKWLKISPQRLARLHQRLPLRHPAWAFLSFLPVIGDPLAVLLGWQKIPFKATILWMTAGKLSRYLLLAAGVKQLFG
ncbi:MAG: YqaA family protein [Neisseria sp.]|nr:YqaA family protein [Neisseria sp.]